MANTKLLGDLRTDALRRCDHETTSFIGRWEANDWLNGSLSELHDRLVARFKQHMFKTATFSLAVGTESYAPSTIPADIFQILKVWYLSGGRRYELSEFQLDEFERFQDPSLPVSASPERLLWRYLGDKLWFTPKPSAIGTIELWYVPQFVPLVDPKLNDGTTNNGAYTSGADLISFAVLPGWEEYIIVDFGIKAREKGEEDPSTFAAQKQAQIERIERMAQQRNAGRPQRMASVYEYPTRGRRYRRP